MIDIAVRRQAREDLEELGRLLRRQHGGRLVQHEDLGAAVERLQDLDALLLADADVLDACIRVDREARSAPASSRTRASRAARSRAARRRASAPPPRTMFSATVITGISMKCWCTIPIPAAIASFAESNATGFPFDPDLALVGPVEPVEDVHQRRLAGAVLAEQRVHLARLEVEVDVVVGDDAGEALGDAAQLEDGGLGHCGAV